MTLKEEAETRQTEGRCVPRRVSHRQNENRTTARTQNSSTRSDVGRARDALEPRAGSGEPGGSGTAEPGAERAAAEILCGSFSSRWATGERCPQLLRMMWGCRAPSVPRSWGGTVAGVLQQRECVGKGKELRGMAGWPRTAAESRRDHRPDLKVCLALAVRTLAALGIAGSPVPTDGYKLAEVSPSFCHPTQPPFPLCPAIGVINLFIQQMITDLLLPRRRGRETDK